MKVLPDTLTLPPSTLTGRGGILALGESCKGYGTHGLLVHGRSLESSGTLGRILAHGKGDMAIRTWCCPSGEPTVDGVDALRAFARESACDWIAAVGGGRVIDAAKAAAGLFDAPLPTRAYQDGAAIPGGEMPFVAAPTTAGTGSEATVVSVLTNPRTTLKRSIRHPSFMARTIILDPALLETCPAAVLAASGMDAFTQAVESFMSRQATWITQSWSLKAAELIAGALPPVHAGDMERAGDLLLGSYLAGIALSNARLGLVHGLAHPLGARYHLPHGLVCAVCLPHVLAFNRPAAPRQYDALSVRLGRDVLDATFALLARLGVESPFEGAHLDGREAVIAETLSSGSTAANPRTVTADDVGTLLDRLFQT